MSLELSRELSLENRKIIDITPRINSKMAVFPGDTPFREEFGMDFKSGHHLSLSSITTTVHLGAHTDAPSHYHPMGETMDRRKLSLYLGKAQVIEVALQKNHRILPNDFTDQIRAPRVLFKTKSFPNPYEWNSDFMSLSTALLANLFMKQVILVGIDTPSVDPADDQKLEAHKAVYKYDMGILEGIVLEHVRPGLYDLIALPLHIEGAEATPVRAILLESSCKKF